MRITRAAGAAALLLALAGCADDGAAPGATAPTTAPTEPTSSISTLSALPMPDMGPPDGEVVADLRQSSRDAALGRFEVWIGNGLARDMNPRSIRYDDPRLRAPIPGERLRLNPAGSERGYPLAIPRRPACGARPRDTGTITIEFGGRTMTVPVEDEADVVERYVRSRCFELAVQEVATLSFSDAVPVEGEGEEAAGTLVLEATPSGRAGGVLTIDAVTGTPVLTAVGGTRWAPDVTVRGDGPVQRVELPVVPARCDDHVFLESGGATAFLVKLHLDGRPGELIVRMSPAGASNAIAYARERCGLD